MAFTFTDVQNLGSVKAQETATTTKKAFNNVTDAVKEKGSQVATGVKGVMPVTNNKFGTLVDEVNANYNELDGRVWDLEFKMEMVAQWHNKALPTDEEMKELRRRWEEKQAEEAKAKAEAEKAQAEATKAAEPETLADALNDPRVLARLKALLFGTDNEVKVELQQESEATEEAPPEEVVEEEQAPVTEEKEKVEGEWKQCIVCNTDISVVYQPDTCPHCRRTAEAEEAKKTGVAPRPRIRFDA